MARKHCAHLFPNLRAKFDYPGKLGQLRLFRDNRVPHPRSYGFASLKAYQGEGFPEALGFPLVFKLDWGGEGDTVFAVPNKARLSELLKMAGRFEQSGQGGFLLQELIPAGNRSLRVTVVGQRLISYWRVGNEINGFGTSLSKGGRLEHDLDPDLQAAGRETVQQLCDRTGINLAGFDLIFAPHGQGDRKPQPLFLEVNWFFGRRGLGGSDAYYKILTREIESWLEGLDLQLHHTNQR